MIQPHDDAHVVTLQIAEFDAKMVMIEQGSRAEIMYPNLFKDLGHKPEDLSKYDVPLIGFEWKDQCSKGYDQVTHSNRRGGGECGFYYGGGLFTLYGNLNNAMASRFRGYISSLHVKLKYPTEGGV